MNDQNKENVINNIANNENVQQNEMDILDSSLVNPFPKVETTNNNPVSNNYFDNLSNQNMAINNTDSNYSMNQKETNDNSQNYVGMTNMNNDIQSNFNNNGNIPQNSNVNINNQKVEQSNIYTDNENKKLEKNQNEIQPKKESSSIISIVFLVIIIALCGYMAYDKLFAGEKNNSEDITNNTDNSNNSNNTNTSNSNGFTNKKFQDLSYSVPSDFSITLNYEGHVYYSSNIDASGLCLVNLQNELASSYNNDTDAYLKYLINDTLYKVSADVNNIEIKHKKINGNSWHYVTFPSTFNTHSFYAFMYNQRIYGLDYFGENDVDNYCNSTINSIINSLKFD